ncbi:helix-turn-helix domain-containing protein [Lichenicoccus sp.]|uniref:helix-turn-helix domain-containing protein n=1 Tax=Lichenicoccus sp. TaxID=2781899 RepID=UPI003D137252
MKSWRLCAQLRAALIRRRLLSGKHSIASVVGSTGFQSTSAFSTAFSRVVGYPPGQVRGATRTMDL